jgi:hypothetical protein
MGAGVVMVDSHRRQFCSLGSESYKSDMKKPEKQVGKHVR